MDETKTTERVCNSFRHCLRDRLRSVKCPSDIIDEIGDWVTAGVGHNYGEGYPLETKAEMMKSIIIMNDRTD